MVDHSQRAIAIVGVGAILPDAPDTATYWRNLTEGRCSITEVTPDRWDPDLYFDDDRQAPDKTYSKIGGWVREWDWSPLEWRLPIPPKVGDAMDRTQKWAIGAVRQALEDYGYPDRPLDRQRTAVVMGNAMAGDKHYLTALRAFFPEYADELTKAPSFSALPDSTRQAILAEMHDGVRDRFPEITEDTMPGELANIIAGRVANLFDFNGPNFVVDAACASAMAAVDAAIEGLEEGDYDAVLTGGVDGNMSASSFIKFCKIGALSATGTRPYGDGADGFVMGEGAAVFLLKRLADAEASGDRIYAVIRGVGGASDGRGKGITAPNPVGQKLAIERAWKNAGLTPDRASYIEGHGTSTKVGDVVEVESLSTVFGHLGLAPGSVPLGSVKSNIGHLKGAAGAAGMLKAALALDARTLPPSIGVTAPNPNADFSESPLYINTELSDWDVPDGAVRSAGVSAFGFGGTNFHVVMEEYVPGRMATQESLPVSADRTVEAQPTLKAPLRGAVVIGGATDEEVLARLETLHSAAADGRAPEPAPPAESDLRAEVRVAIDYADADDLATKADRARTALEAGNAAAWKMLRNQGVFLGRGEPHQVAFLYTGQGSQYVNMLAGLRQTEPLVAEVFDEADRVMEPILGRPLSDYIFADPDDDQAMGQAEEELRQTEITQPAVLATDLALTRLLEAYGIRPDMVMGHSLGEYAALGAAGALPFAHALEAVAARGREMTAVSIEDNGLMAAVFAPLDEIQAALDAVDGYVVIANLNSETQAVIGGASPAVEAAMQRLSDAGHQVVQLPVSHAFHTEIVAPASGPLKDVLARLDLEPPHIPIVANVTGEFYPMGPAVTPDMLEILGRQVASPVQFVRGLHTLHDAGVRTFIEVGPKRALQGFVDDVLGDEPGIVSLAANHPKTGDLVSFNQALCGLYAAGLGVGTRPVSAAAPVVAAPVANAAASAAAPAAPAAPAAGPVSTGDDPYVELGHLFAEFLERGQEIYQGVGRTGATAAGSRRPAGSGEPVVITGASLGLPGTAEVFDDGNIGRILDGNSFIDAIPVGLRNAIVDKHITRLVKSESGGGSFETIESADEVIKLAGRKGHLDLVTDFGYPEDRLAALDSTTQLAIAAGIDALRDAGIPLVMHYKTTTTGSKLPERWGLPTHLRDGTGVIFASAFPGYDRLVDEISRFEQDHARRQRLQDLQHLRERVNDGDPVIPELDHMIHEVRTDIEQNIYEYDRRFIFKVLSMGHSQFAEYIGARGPNTQVNAACASTTQAVALAEDWIRLGRCERVIVIAADDVTNDTMLPWIGTGFLATGAAATDEVVEEAALPFDRRRHGMIVGMGAAAIVVEDRAAARARGLNPICDVLGSVVANSAFHGTRLDVSHICDVMEHLVSDAERRWGLDRRQLAGEMVFVSHETYTPARGGSAQAEVDALRHVFGADADAIVVANSKGFTGHAMGAGIEDVLAVKALETGIVPPIANVKEVDPDLGHLNLSKGGRYPVRYALRLGAGFGSQISMSLMRWTPTPDGARPEADELGYDYRVTDRNRWAAWLREVSGYDEPDLEIVGRTFRVRDEGPPAETTAPEVKPRRTSPATPMAPAPAAPAPVPASAPPAAPAPAATAAPTAGGPTPQGSDATADPVVARVLEVVAAQTGYPPEMLDPELDLEADLGIDTVKQAETFAAIREEYGIERDDNLSLRDYPTLASVVGFVRERATGLPDTPTATEGPTPQPSDSTADPVVARVLEVVAAQTGYPPEMLDPELDLEADLGIDTVKQAETFAAIREEYGIERDDNLSLRDYPTLASVVGFVRERATGLPDTPTATEGPTPQPSDPLATDQTPAATATAVTEIMAGDDEASAAIPRRLATSVLRPDLDLCVETGITIADGSRVLVMLDDGGVGAALVKKLESLGADVLAIDDTPDADELLGRINEWRGDEAVQGIYWLPALDPEAPLADLDLVAWKEALRVRVKLLFRTLRHLYESVGEPGTFLVSATRLGGRHGYDDVGAVAPMGGGVVGVTKTFKRERPDALVKAVDFAPSRKTAALADVLIAETQRDPGVVEVGHHDDGRFTVTLREQPMADEPDGLELGSESVFVVTGAAGSIVSAIIGDLARASRGVFHLLDLAPEPDRADPDLAAFGADRDGLKRTIFERLKASEERATPAMVEKELAGIERRHAALAAIQAVEEAGGTAHYHSVNLLDAEAMASVTDRISTISGRVDMLVHAGGLEISRLMPDKEPAEFDLVFDVKSDGWFHLLKGLADVPVASTVVFSSIAGRFGNGGQADYSAANDLLCKWTSSFKTTRPDTIGLAVDWTAWGDIGMATRGSIPTVMKAAGIDMLPAAAGIPIVRRELVGDRATRELLVGQRLGVLTEPLHPTGGLDPAALGSRVGPEHTAVITDVAGAGIDDGLTVVAALDPTSQPFLDDHRIDGTPVLPGVMGIESFAEVAALAYPDHSITAIEEVAFVAPFKFYRDEPRELKVMATFSPDGDDIVAHCRLLGERTLANQDEPQVTEHFTGRVRLSPDANPPETIDPSPESDTVVAADDVYRIYFHGPAYQVLDRAWASGDGATGLLAGELPPNHAGHASTITDPRLIELCFQTAGVWEIAADGSMALPTRIDRVVPGTPASETSGPLQAEITPTGEGGFDAAVVDSNGTVVLRLEGYRTIQMPGSLDDGVLAPLRTGMGAAG